MTPRAGHDRDVAAGVRWSDVGELDAVCRETLQARWGGGVGFLGPVGAVVDRHRLHGLPGVGDQESRAAASATPASVHQGARLPPADGHGRVHRGGRARAHARRPPGSARAAASVVAEAISRVRDGSATGPLTLCADSAFYGKSVLWNCQNAGVQFSVTVRMDKSIRAAIDAIPDRAWTPIDY